MGALANLQAATERLNSTTGEVVAALNKPAGVPESDVQNQANAVNAAVDQIQAVLHPVAIP